MTTKAQIKGGLNALFDRTDQDTNDTPTTDAQAVEGAKNGEQSEEREELINTIEDEALREALRKRRLQGRGRPRKGVTKGGNEYSRTSLIVNEAKYAKVKEIALRNTLTTKEVLEAAMDLLIERYETKYGTIKVHANQEKKDINELLK